MLAEKPLYKLNLTIGGLLRSASIEFVDLYLKSLDWEKAFKEAHLKNITNSNKESSSKRLLHEVQKRIECLSLEQLKFFQEASYQEKLYMLLLALAKKTKFVYDLLRDLSNKFAYEGHKIFEKKDYNIFFQDQSLIYPELESVSHSKYIKFRSYVFKSLKEARIINDKYEIQEACLSKEFVKSVSRENQEDLIIFPRIL